ncbi:endonuclease [Streptomyces sp. CA-210063]|uniref:endonuclease I family protein n=1 Tax=Streptomyces sp. CA-210063 TaxID=2801029 RepID=UPI00214CFAF0|nr:endonuclease [Streptomyces sp. CA-210063]UUU33749.1 endonuclease [Streptomyces sp. CA-210063]
MPAARIRSWKTVAFATSAVLVGLVLPTATAAPASATTTAYDSTYYKNAIGKTGTSLKSSLHTIISPQTKLSYSAVWEALKVTDQDPSNSSNVKLLYSGISRSKSLNGGNSGNWNREHVWAQSHGDFGTSAGPGTDLHHLRPEDVAVNARRGNLDFDNGGSSFTNSGGSLADTNSFEPRDAVKGDVARMILYMAVRYEGDDGWPNLEPNDLVTNGGTRFHGRLSVLKAWNDEDPPDSFEERRNDLIYSNYQGNRNPFIDHPEWIEAIW